LRLDIRERGFRWVLPPSVRFVGYAS